MAFPRHLERLVKSHVQGNISRSTEHVSVAHFARPSRSETTIRRNPIAEEVRSSEVIPIDWIRLNGLNANTIRLHVPIRGPDTTVKRRSGDWQSTVPTENTRRLPATKHLFCE